MCSLLTRVDEASKRRSCCFSHCFSRLQKSQIRAKQKIGCVWSLSKGFKDWLDSKCNLHEVIQVSRNHFCVVHGNVHTHFARRQVAHGWRCLVHSRNNSHTDSRFKETLIRILNLKTGLADVSRFKDVSSPFGTGEITFWYLPFTAIKTTHLFIS